MTTPLEAHELEDSLREQCTSGKLELPLLPEAAQRVLAATSNENVDARELADLVRRDAAFAANVLRISNSAAYAARSPIVSLQQAIGRLGFRAVKDIAVIISCQTRAFQVRGFEPEVRLLFHHCLAAALWAQEVARARRLNVEEAFLGGLLHDIGRPVLIQAAVDLATARHAPPPSKELLDPIVRELHQEVGELLIRAWGLAPRLALTVRHHHDPGKAGEMEAAAALLQLSDALSHSVVGPRPVTDDELREHPASATLNLYPEDIDKLLAKRGDIATQVEALA